MVVDGVLGEDEVALSALDADELGEGRFHDRSDGTGESVVLLWGSEQLTVIHVLFGGKETHSFDYFD